MNEFVRNQLELESFTNNFFDVFSQSILEDNRTKCFWRTVGCFIRLGDDNG